jgi:hypothetical protein
MGRTSLLKVTGAESSTAACMETAIAAMPMSKPAMVLRLDKMLRNMFNLPGKEPRLPRILLDFGSPVTHIPALRVLWYRSITIRTIARKITVSEEASAGIFSIGNPKTAPIQRPANIIGILLPCSIHTRITRYQKINGTISPYNDPYPNSRASIVSVAAPSLGSKTPVPRITFP